ncbi:MAG: phosphate transport system regulatory protein PhoU [Phycisphaeraceae bacterium]|nr:phosphate transport system regulatory protein PhoU [Phycisphaeraceae bacterium]
MAGHLFRQVEKLKRMLLSVGALVEEALRNAVTAIERRDGNLAQDVIDGDRQVDLKEIEVEEECLATLALHQPVAQDLRYVVAVLKINNDLERIADQAANLAEQAGFLSEERRIDQVPFDLHEMARMVISMLKRSLDALVNEDIELAHSVRGTDDEVDEVHRQMCIRAAELIQQNPLQASQIMHYQNISRQLERIADHTCNIAEDVIYLVRGDIVRHGGAVSSDADAQRA